MSDENTGPSDPSRRTLFGGMRAAEVPAPEAAPREGRIAFTRRGVVKVGMAATVMPPPVLAVPALAAPGAAVVVPSAALTLSDFVANTSYKEAWKFVGAVEEREWLDDIAKAIGKRPGPKIVAIAKQLKSLGKNHGFVTLGVKDAIDTLLEKPELNGPKNDDVMYALLNTQYIRGRIENAFPGMPVTVFHDPEFKALLTHKDSPLDRIGEEYFMELQALFDRLRVRYNATSFADIASGLEQERTAYFGEVAESLKLRFSQAFDPVTGLAIDNKEHVKLLTSRTDLIRVATDRERSIIEGLEAFFDNTSLDARVRWDYHGRQEFAKRLRAEDTPKAITSEPETSAPAPAKIECTIKHDRAKDEIAAREDNAAKHFIITAKAPALMLNAVQFRRAIEEAVPESTQMPTRMGQTKVEAQVAIAGKGEEAQVLQHTLHVTTRDEAVKAYLDRCCADGSIPLPDLKQALYSDKPKGLQPSRG